MFRNVQIFFPPNSIEIRLLTALEWPSFFRGESIYRESTVFHKTGCYLFLDSLFRSVYTARIRLLDTAR